MNNRINGDVLIARFTAHDTSTGAGQSEFGTGFSPSGHSPTDSGVSRTIRKATRMMVKPKQTPRTREVSRQPREAARAVITGRNTAFPTAQAAPVIPVTSPARFLNHLRPVAMMGT